MLWIRWSIIGLCCYVATICAFINNVAFFGRPVAVRDIKRSYNYKDSAMKRILIPIMILMFLAAVLAIYGCDKERIVTDTEYIHEVEYIESPPDTVTITITDTVYINQGGEACSPSEPLAMTALQYYSNDEVMNFIYGEFGYTEGWIYYLTEFQCDVTESSTGVFDVYGYVDFWMSDFSAYYPMEFNWRIRYTSGDPTDPTNWTLEDPPLASSGHIPGLRLVDENSRVENNFK